MFGYAFLKDKGYLENKREFGEFLTEGAYKKALDWNSKDLIVLFVRDGLFNVTPDDKRVCLAIEQASRWDRLNFTEEELGIFHYMKEQKIIDEESDHQFLVNFLTDDPYEAVKNKQAMQILDEKL